MRFLILTLLSLLMTGAAWAAKTPPLAPYILCETAITTAEYTGRLPARLLGAIALVESGRLNADANIVRPWPWTINAEGSGQFFATKNDAIAAVKALQARGVQSIDVGCMQINLMYHPDAFTSLDDAFDPRTNALYAARFLNTLHAAGGDWTHAIGAYHSETPDLGEAYRALVMLRWQNPILTAKTSQSMAYGAFLPREQVYGAFAGSALAYGDSPVPPLASVTAPRR